MGFHCTITMPGLPRLQSDVIHWRTRAKERKIWRAQVMWAIRSQTFRLPFPPLERAALVFTRHSASQPDDDNLRSSFKPVRDGLIGIWIRDDTPDVVVDPVYQWEKAPRGKGRITVEVREIQASREVRE